MVPLLDTKAITVVCANIEDILLVNTVSSILFVRSCYSTRIVRHSSVLWKNARKRSASVKVSFTHYNYSFFNLQCRLFVDNIGDILERHISNMNVYMVSQASVLDVFLLTISARNTVSTNRRLAKYYSR